MDQNLLQGLIDFVKMASPTVWGVFLKQVQVQLIIQCVVTGILMALSVASATVGVIWLKLDARLCEEDKDYKKDDRVWGVLGGVAFLVLTVCVIVILSKSFPDIIQYHLNPDFSAIQIMLREIHPQ